MPRPKIDPSQIYLTHVQSGDMDNGVYYSYFAGNEDKKVQALKTVLTKKHVIEPFIHELFNGDISDDMYRRMTTFLTFIETICEHSGDGLNVRPDALFFALLVNWNASRGNGTNKIRSYGALQAAQSNALSKGIELDYREFIVNGESESKFSGDYITILVNAPQFGNKFQINLPIIPMKLGLFKLATEHVAAYMTIVGDPDNTSHTIPAYLWLQMIEEGMSRRITTKFSKLEGKSLSKLISTDNKYYEEILSNNDFRMVDNFMDIYDIEFEDDGTLVLRNTNEPPEFSKQAAGLEWAERNGSSYYLKYKNFYLVSKLNGMIWIFSQK